MRGYEIEIKDKDGKLWVPPSLSSIDTGASFSSQLSGGNNPGALDIYLDIPVATFALPAGGSFVRIFGPGLKEISDASNLNNYSITVKAGMRKGLPLATADFNAGQYGLLVQGTIYQAYGNWIGLEQTIDLQLQPPMGTNSDPVNLIVNWKAGKKLSEALKQTLSTAFPDYKVTMNISDALVLQQDQIGFHYTMAQLAQYVNEVSKVIKKDKDYNGVQISVQGMKILVDDGTVESDPKKIEFYDLIGQPTWLDDSTIQFKTPMRADINPFDWIKMPETVVTQGFNAPSPFTNAKLTFQGKFQVQDIRHVGLFRQPDADAWCSIFNAITTPVFQE